MDDVASAEKRLSILRHNIEQRRDDLVELTRQLIRIPTLNPPGECYRDICEFLAARLKARGFTVRLLRATGTPGDSDRYPRWNVIARREGSASGPCVHFNSHTDVVETGRGWSVDPFEGLVRDGKVYGRGACDMKGGLAASIIAAEAYIAAFPDHPGTIEISGTADEETGGYGGVAWLAEQGYFSPERVQHVIIPEPLNKERICRGHRGVWWAEITTHGRIAHGSMPFLGDCAVRHMGAVMMEMEERLFPALAERRTEMPVVPDGARQSTMNINSLHGGQAEPEPDFTGFPSACVPDSARMVIDRRYLVEENYDDVRAEIVELLERVRRERADFDYDLSELWHVNPSLTEPDAPVVGAVAQGIRRVLGCEPVHVLSPGTYDQKHIDRIGRLKDCIAYGPGILDLAHQPDEYVGISDMQDSALVMALAIDDLLHARQKRQKQE
ncbi:acetylornithine deacetylase/succinyl-diaminopimelate desuccinylase family protein [Pseudohoeflea coraliihabitans]|uniref:Acetylornithine deacetylase/succinyl-diaminopimelate desuccinylase family protein n=1 Tax=Pseudohoeflea coraliihabitans TaxID=2860393 RepID=A0ABS6WSX8_9HYPH|nr:acetylornithine deacetylase/succinyl-diaminopimelate desuccinylase family protein [Pseudohoeflea sp. DP4N28-3]MBW3099064.1 acetylornithine deacetylase/succinyl-diaminopimelate desuccinylase family protein [Pseudohoeflea sp. DP4N28-3]